MTAHAYRTTAVPVVGGDLHLGVWDAEGRAVENVLLVHGITSSHLAWPWVVERLPPGVRAIAPDLRGRGRSNRLPGPTGMRAHADDVAAALDALDVERTLVVGHSMGAFVAVVFAHLHPERVSRLVLVDGGLPLDVPAGLDPGELVAAILGPTAARLSMRFASTQDHRGFWRRHPAFQGDWSPALDTYLDYDLEDDGDGAFSSATRYETAVDDTVDLNIGSALPEALAALAHPARLLTAPRGLRDEPPGLYAPDYLERMLPAHPRVVHERIDGVNHYTIVMSDVGADAVARVVRAQLGAVAP